MQVDTSKFREDDHLEAKAFYMRSLNGLVKKCPHGQFDLQNDDSQPIRCIHCNAKLLPSEVPEIGKTNLLHKCAVCLAKSDVKDNHGNQKSLMIHQS